VFLLGATKLRKGFNFGWMAEGSGCQGAQVCRLVYLLRERGDMHSCELLKLQDESLRGFYNTLKQIQAEGWCDIKEGMVRVAILFLLVEQRYLFSYD